jgi:TonB family protein
VIINFLIDVDGKTRDVHILQSSGRTDLDDASKECVADFHYKPALLKGLPIAVRKSMQITWSFEGVPCGSPK